MTQQELLMLDKAFPNEAELNILQSKVKQVGRSEVLANDNHFLKSFYNFIQRTNYMKVINMPQNLKDAVQLLLCERTYLIQLIKGLIYRMLPKERPNFFNDSFLEAQFSQIQAKTKLQPATTRGKKVSIELIESRNDYQQDVMKQQAAKQMSTPLITTTMSSRVQSEQQARSAASKTVIEEVISGAGSLISHLGKKLISPKSNVNAHNLANAAVVNKNTNQQRKENRFQRQSIQSIQVIKNERSRLVHTNTKYNEMMQQKRAKQMIIEDLSESDDGDVDVPDSDAEIEEESKTIRSMQSIAVKRKSISPLREKQTPLYSIIKSSSPNSKLLGFISQSNINTSNNSSVFSKINQRYLSANRDDSNLDHEEDELDRIFYGENDKNSIKFKNVDDNINQQIISILDKSTNNNNSGFYFEDDRNSRSMSLKSRYTIHNLQNSDTKSPYVKSNTLESHFQQSAIKHSSSLNNQTSSNNNNNRFQQDLLSQDSSQNNLKFSHKAVSQIQETDREENEGDQQSEYESPERKQRKSIGFKILMSRESSFGIVGFQSENLTRNNTRRSSGGNNNTLAVGKQRLSNVRDSELQRQQNGFKKQNYGFQNESMQQSQTHQSVYYPNSKMLQSSKQKIRRESTYKSNNTNEYYFQN